MYAMRRSNRLGRESGPELRRIANAAFFERIYLTEEGEPTAVPTETFASARGLDTVAGATYSTSDAGRCGVSIRSLARPTRPATPRKILGWATPAEAFQELCSRQATATCCTPN